MQAFINPEKQNCSSKAPLSNRIIQSKHSYAEAHMHLYTLIPPHTHTTPYNIDILLVKHAIGSMKTPSALVKTLVELKLINARPTSYARPLQTAAAALSVHIDVIVAKRVILAKLAMAKWNGIVVFGEGFII